MEKYFLLPPSYLLLVKMNYDTIYFDHAILKTIDQKADKLEMRLESLVLAGKSPQNREKDPVFADALLTIDKAVCSIEIPERRYIRSERPFGSPFRGDLPAKIRKTTAGIIYKSEMSDMLAGLTDSDILGFDIDNENNSRRFTLAAEDNIYILCITGSGDELNITRTVPVPAPSEKDYTALLRFLPALEQAVTDRKTPLLTRILISVTLKILHSEKLSISFKKKTAVRLIPKTIK